MGPIKVNGEFHPIPMATTEGALIASTNRGARAISESGGTTAVVVEDGMTRAPVFRCESVIQAAEIKSFLDTEEGFSLVSNAFGTTTKHGKMEVDQTVFIFTLVYSLLCIRQSSSYAS